MLPSADSPDGAVTVSLGSLVDELMLLRRRDGATIGRIERTAPRLMSLRATSAEIVRLKLQETDRALAAQNVLRCAISRKSAETRAYRFLRAAFNVDLSHLQLQDRVHRLEEEFGMSWGWYTTKRQQDLIAELSGQLIVTQASPCGIDEAGNAEPVTDNNSTHINLSLKDILTLFAEDDRQGVLEKLAQAELGRRLPRGLAATADSVRGPDHDLRRLQVMIERVLDRYGQARYDARSGDQLTLTNRELADALSLDFARRQRAESAYRQRTSRGSDSYFRSRRNGCEELANILEFIEARDRQDSTVWRHVISANPGPGQSALSTIV